MVKLGHYYDLDKSFFKIFAPNKKSVVIEIDTYNTKIKLNKIEDGYWIGSCNKLPEGVLYWVNVDGERSFPDPTSRYQPFGVHGASMVVNPQKVNSSNWSGTKIEDAIIYELHIGTFTPEGNLKSATNKIEYLSSLGINVIELMPIFEFPGSRDWGYDCVNLFSLERTYGNYNDLKEFIETAHIYKISVILDVVYNHFGPEGNYTGYFAKYTKKSQTPWGASINFDQNYSNGIRDFYLSNVEWWLKDIGFDGFRLDAWAMIEDSSSKRIQREIVDLAHSIGKLENRNILVIAEHLRNDVLVVSSDNDGDGCDSQWVDDFGLSIRSFLSPDKNDKLLKSFYQFDDIYTSLKQCFVLDGSRFSFAFDGYIGTNPKDLKPYQNVVYIQNHDMIGNRIFGDRFTSIVNDINKVLLAAFTLFSSNFVPMIFMGEEYAEVNPFPFFESFTDESLITAVREGRKKEWLFTKKEPLDSHDYETFNLARLNWNLLKDQINLKILNIYKKLIDLKKEKIIGHKSKVRKGSNNNTLIIENGCSIVLLNFNNETVNFEKDFSCLDKCCIILNSNENNKKMKIESFSAQILELKSV